MRPIGFSTGAVAYADFRAAIGILEETHTDAIELSALRSDELPPLVDAVASLPLQRYRHVSVHLPSHFSPSLENEFCDLIKGLPEGWPLVIHPDVIRNFDLWRKVGSRVCIENMDKRKPIGQTRSDLLEIFDKLPEASLCFDLGHAHQIDPTMCEAMMILEEFRGKLAELHISEVNSESKHDPISVEAQRSFEMVVRMIPAEIPVILESRVATPGEFLGHEVRRRIEHEVRLVEALLRTPVPVAAD
jgi:hypothetical protein